MTDKEIINDFYTLITRKVKENGLNTEADKIKLDSFFIGQKAVDSRLDYNITQDIRYIHADLVYVTGILFALRPYINNPINETAILKGKEFSTYRQNMYDSLYGMYASICFEKLYNFWDRIGDKIANEFPDKFPNPRAIMFANVIENLKTEYQTNHNIKWLIDFKDGEFKDFNEKRKVVVHYEHIETKYKELILSNTGDMTKIKEIFLEKSGLPEFFQKHIKLTNEGIKQTYDFVKSRT
ncbi:hypothetical protein SAMN05421766_10261 [Zobellia uliginosa]|uniref:Cthe-2314-like HEPN domain-containing protein n=1 Tax=Zobellia uliginosa TaxID=143224 RepID=A0ABY1KL06_9FLAO|nr:Cthe_2314 family HEPN domain-containing protein [Zobellia uliginosa]SIS46832.1 hypothetical protein SAMN05421766_10261 [Zobellia uliginosa]